MGAYDSAQMADLIGIYILDAFGQIFNLEQIRLYRDDGLIFILEINVPKTLNIYEKITRDYRLQGLRIKITSNLKKVNFLDIILNLENNTFKPKEISHPPTSMLTLTTSYRYWNRNLMSSIRG